MTRMTFPETALVRLPAGTMDLLRVAAEREGSTPAEVMRRAIVRAVAVKVPAARKRLSQQV